MRPPPPLYLYRPLRPGPHRPRPRHPAQRCRHHRDAHGPHHHVRGLNGPRQTVECAQRAPRPPRRRAMGGTQTHCPLGFDRR